MGLPLKSQFCANHPDRPGRALCMSCKKILCQECATGWEGINYCVNCLRAKREHSGERGAFWAAALVVAASALLLFLTAHLMAWSAAVLARTF